MPILDFAISAEPVVNWSSNYYRNISQNVRKDFHMYERCPYLYDWNTRNREHNVELHFYRVLWLIAIAKNNGRVLIVQILFRNAVYRNVTMFHYSKEMLDGMRWCYEQIIFQSQRSMAITLKTKIGWWPLCTGERNYTENRSSDKGK